MKLFAAFSCSQLKEEVAKKLDDPPKGVLCLIFAGKILKDEESLESQGKETFEVKLLGYLKGGHSSRPGCWIHN